MPDFMTIYLKTRINVGGLMPKPNPVIEVARANDKCLDLQLRDYANDKLVIDLTGFDVAFIVREEKYSLDHLILKQTVDGGITVDTVEEGKIIVSFTAEDLDLPATDYWYDLSLIDALDNVTTHTVGKFKLLQ